MKNILKIIEEAIKIRSKIDQNLDLGGSWGTLGPSTAPERRVTIHYKYEVIGAWAYYAFST